MKIKEFGIWKYGPLSGAGKVEPDNFTVFYGPNEQGKTLTVDALVKLLLRKSYREFGEKINRVNELPEGYVLLEREDGTTVKLPEAGNLTRVSGMTASECRNIFIIRDSDLSINRESEFYKGVTNRLTGLQTEEIGRIKSSIREQVQLTPGLEFRDTSPKKLKSALAKAEVLAEGIRELKGVLETEGYDRFEFEQVQITAGIKNAELHIKHFEEARCREIYQKGSRALELLQEACRESISLQGFSRENLDRWQGLQSRVESLRKNEKDTREKAASINEELLATRRRADEIGGCVHLLEQTAALFSERVEPELREYVDRSRELAGRESLGNNLITSRAVLFISILLLISLAGALLRPYWWLLPIVALNFGVILIFGGTRLNLARLKGRLAALGSGICSRAAGLGAVVESPKELLAWWGEHGRRLAEEGQRLTATSNKVALLENLREQFETDLGKLAETIKLVELDLRGLMQEAGVCSLQEYREKLGMKIEFENRIRQQKAVLESLFNPGGGFLLSEQISTWENDLKELAPFAGLGTGFTYDEQQFSLLKEKAAELRRRQVELTEKWDTFREQLHSIEHEVNSILLGECGRQLYCQTLTDLEAACSYLREWIEHHQNNRRLARAALELFDQIAAEEELKILELFAEQSSLNRQFEEITGGRYTAVVFDREQHRIMVEPAGGGTLSAEQLSGGAYDQLYFSIRIALGQKLMKGETGFFILDDPFIKADPDRLGILLKMLFRLVDSGWQVLYFSAKGEVRDTLQKMGSSGSVSLMTVNMEGGGW